MFESSSNLVPTESKLLSSNTQGLVPVDFYSINDSETDTDSFFVRQGRRRFEVRLAGIDAPEIAHHTAEESKHGQKYGAAATETMRSILRHSSSGNQLFLQLTGENTYGREVAIAYYRDDKGKLVNLNQELVKQKAAYLYTDPRYLDRQVATPELIQLYESYIQEGLEGKGTGIYSKDALYPGTFRHSLGEKIGEPLQGILAKVGLSKPLPTVLEVEQKRMQRDAGAAEAVKAGFSNQLASYFGSGEKNEILPSKHGASFFYDMAIFNARMQNAGLPTVDPQSQEGYASAAYRVKYVAKHGNLPTDLPWYVTQYDKEMGAPGLGYYINEWAITQGYGRLYKEEVGALASVAGGLGRILDKAYNYYKVTTSDQQAILQDADPNAIFKEPPAGFFEGSFSFATNFALTTASAVFTYFTLGIPYGYVTAELFKTSVQGLLDTALEQGGKVPLMGQKAAVIAALGPEFLQFKDTQSLREALIERIRTAQGEDSPPGMYQTLDTVISWNNIAQRRRAGILFDNVVDPFISEMVNPYSPTVGGKVNPKWAQLQDSLNSFGDELRKPIYLAVEEGSNRIVFKNVGYERQKSVAKSIDDLLMHIPANVAKWSWGRGTYSNPENFVRLGEVFSFTDLLKTFEDSLFADGINQVLARSEVINESSLQGRVLGKTAAAFQIPMQLIGQGVQRFKQGFGLINPLLAEHRQLRQLQSEMIKAGILSWEDESFKRLIQFGGPPTPQASKQLDQFFNQVASYQQKLSNPLKVGNRQYDAPVHKLLERAVNYSREQNLRINKLRQAGRQISTNPFSKSKGMLWEVAAAGLVAEMIFGDIAGSSGASLFSQVALSLNKDQAGPAEFNATYLFSLSGALTGTPNRILDSALWSGVAIASGWYLSKFTQGVELHQFKFGNGIEQQLEQWAAQSSFKINGKMATASDLVEQMHDLLVHQGLPVIRGNRFKSFLFITAGVLGAGRLGTQLATGGLNLIRSIPFIGEAVFGKGSVKPNENFILATQLGGFRNEVFNRLSSGASVSDLEIQSAYFAGLLSNQLSITDRVRKAEDVRVIAKQAPLPVFQFFMTETIKGRRFDDNGIIQQKGKVFYTVGMQTAPVLGGNFSLGIPLGLNLDAANPLGVSLVYNDQDNNLLNYMGALGALGSTAAGVALATIGLLEGTAGALKLAKPLLFNRGSGAIEDLMAASNFVKASAKTFNSLLEGFVRLPQAGYNMARGVMAADLDIYNSLGRTTVYRPGANEIPTISRFMRAGIIGAIALGTSRVAADLFTDDEKTINNIGMAGASVAALAGMFSPELAQFSSPVFEKLAVRNLKWSETLAKELKYSNFKVPMRQFLAPVLTSMTASYLMTSSWFQYSNGMDSDSASQIATIAAYTAVNSFVFIKSSDMGLTPGQTISNYQKFQAIAEREAGNPLAWARKVYAQYRSQQLRGDLQDYTSQVRQFIYRASRNAASELSQDVAKDDAIKQMKLTLESMGDDVNEAIVNPAMRQGLEQIFDRPDIQRYLRGRGRGPSRLLRGVVAVSATSALFGAVAQAVGQLRGGYGQEGINRFYEAIDPLPIIGKPLGNLFRLMTGRDKTIYDQSVDLTKILLRDSSGRKIQQIGQHILQPNDPQTSRLNRILKDLMAPMVMDPTNAYQSVLPFAGVTFRPDKEGGTKVSAYLQVQSAGQDISTAVYSMAGNTLRAGMGRGELGMLIQQHLNRIAGNTPLSQLSPEQMRLLARSVRAATAQLSNLNPKQKRKFSTPMMDAETNLVGSSSLLSLSIRERIRRSSELAAQPYESIASRMSDTADPSMLMGVGNSINPNDPLRAVNAGMSAQDQQALSLTNLNSLKAHIFNPLGHLFIRGFDFSLDRTKNRIQSNPLAIEDTSEWVQYTSAYLDIASEEPTTQNIFLKLFQSVDGLLSAAPFAAVFKPAVYVGAMIGSAFLLTGSAASIAFKTEAAAVLNSLEVPRSLFDVSASDRKAAFWIDKSAYPGRANTVEHFEITRGTQTYKITLPKGTDLSDKGLAKTQSQLINAFGNIEVTVQNKTHELMESVFHYTQDFKWNGMVRGTSEIAESAAGQLHLNISNYFDNYIDQVFDQFLTTQVGDVSLSALVSRSDMGTLASSMKAELKNKIADLLDRELAGRSTGKLSDQLLKRYVLNNEKEMANYLSYLIFQEVGGLFKSLKANLLILEPVDISAGHKLEKRMLEEMADGKVALGPGDTLKALRTQRSAYTNALNASDFKDLDEAFVEGVDSLRNLPTGRARLSRFEGLKHLGGTAASVFGMGEALDIYGSFSRLAAAQDNPDITDAQERYLYQHAGGVVTSSAIGIGISWAADKLLRNMDKIGKLLGRQKGKVGIAAALTTAAFVFGRKWIRGAYEGIVSSEPYKMFTNFVGSITESVQEGIGWFTGDFIPGLTSNVTFGLIKKSTATQAIGTGLAAASIALVLGNFVKLGGAAIGAAGAVGAVVGGGLSLIPGFNGFMGGFTSSLVDKVSKIPGIGGWLVTPFEQGMYKASNPQMEPGSSIYLATAQQAIAMEDRKYLLAAADPTGSRTKGLFTNPSLYSSSYGDTEPAAALFGNPLRPIMDSFLDRELSIKSQYYNQSVVGQATWAKMIRGAENYQQLKAITQNQALGNPQVQIAQRQIEGQQQKELERLKQDLASKAKGQPTQAQASLAAAIFKRLTGLVQKDDEKLQKTVVVPKQQIQNSILKQQAEAVLQVFGKMPVLSTQVSGEQYGNTVSLSQGIADSNDLLLEMTQGRVNPLNYAQQGYSF